MARQTHAQRQVVCRANKRAAGYILKQMWVHPDDWPEIKATRDRLSKRHTKKS